MKLWSKAPPLEVPYSNPFKEAGGQSANLWVPRSTSLLVDADKIVPDPSPSPVREAPFEPDAPLLVPLHRPLRRRPAFGMGRSPRAAGR